MRKILIIAFLVVCVSAAVAQEHQHGEHHGSEELGKVEFPISCSPQSQKQFNRALALLHDFWYMEAEKQFATIVETEPGCAMAYWGVAMSNYHPLWAAPTPAEMERGKTAVDKALALGAKTDREKAYIGAIALFYKGAENSDHRTRALAYAKAMEGVHQENPDDLEAAVFHALALLGTAQASDKTYAVQKQAAAILNPLARKAPQHPGIAHYIIHSFDYPSLAELALPAARIYAKIAPSSPHALHMPSHIFTRLGLWPECISSNAASAELARKHVRKTMPDAGSFDQLHAMDYLVYAYLQLGQEEKARKVMEEAAAMTKIDLPNVASSYALAAMPARFAIERHQWKEAAALQIQHEWFPWDKFPYAEAITHYAKGLGAARTGDPDTARKAVERLKELAAAQNDKDQYWASQIEIQRQSVAAWIAFADGKKEEAVKMMRTAAEMEDATEKHPVTPGAIVPAHELLGQMYLELNQPKEALKEFEKSMTTAPNRLNAYVGAAKAAAMAENAEKAREYRAKVDLLKGVKAK